MQLNVYFSDAKHEVPDDWKRKSLNFWARGFLEQVEQYDVMAT